MNKVLLLLTVISCIFLSTVQAQIKKGATLLGGNLGAFNQKYSSPDSIYNKQRNLSASLSFGKAVRENLILGGSASWGEQIASSPGPVNRYKLRSWGAGVFLRKYKQLGKSAFYLFAQAALRSEFLRDTRNEVYQSKAKIWRISASAYPGISFAVSKRFQIETGLADVVYLGYQKNKENTSLPGSMEKTTSDFSFSSSIDNLSSLYLGFRILLN